MSLQKEMDQLANLEGVTIDTNALLADGKNAKQIFCKGWPATKLVLESIATMIKNPVVKIVIGIIVKAGDALEVKTCEV